MLCFYHLQMASWLICAPFYTWRHWQYSKVTAGASQLVLATGLGFFPFPPLPACSSPFLSDARMIFLNHIHDCVIALFTVTSDSPVAYNCSMAHETLRRQSVYVPTLLPLLLDIYAPAVLKHLRSPKHVMPFSASFFCHLEFPLSGMLLMSYANFALLFVLQN